MKPRLDQSDLDQLRELIISAGEEVMHIYQDPELSNTQQKSDNSPLTAADLAAHNRLSQGLKQISDIPILSEESSPEDYALRRDWETFWLIDPLDGTKEFLARNGQFTLNIALIHQGQAILGLVYQPTEQLLYLGLINHKDQPFSGLEAGAWRQKGNSPASPIHCQPPNPWNPLKCLTSQHHNSPESDQYLEKLASLWPSGIEKTPRGSSLKICAIAEGSADIYLRIGPTSEWDTAAAQAVLEAAGGQLLRFNANANPFRYNQRTKLLNENFCAAIDAKLIIRHLLSDKIEKILQANSPP